MICTNCSAENSDMARFCAYCGSSLSPDCPRCGHRYPPDSRFCPQCGKELPAHPPQAAMEPEAPETDSVPAKHSAGERKYVTVLFSDLSGYTTLSEKMDPEDVRDIIRPLFAEITAIVNRYNGRGEKYIGDAVMALFGIDTAYEDDPIRAIHAAREIHSRVTDLSAKLKDRIGMPLSMHSGINTGLVVTGGERPESGRHGVMGDTINLAARLCHIGSTGEILVGPDTYLHARAHFVFHVRRSVKVKGKASTINVYEVMEPIDRPRKIHRFYGLRSALIGRDVELAFINKANSNLQQGIGTIFAIYGSAGTGKSRLVEEFKNALDLNKVQWLSGHAYSFSQNVPYFPLINLLNNALNIEENDPPKKVRKKIELLIRNLVPNEETIVPYIGRLYNLDYPEAEQISPEAWKARLHAAVLEILTAFAHRGPTIVCLEDLHWADPSSLELIRFLLSDFRYPVLFLCVYRPVLSLLTGQHVHALGRKYQEIRLQDLSLSETQEMITSLLKAREIPPDLMWYIHNEVEGNPFYIEELINSLMDSGNLVRERGQWRLKNAIDAMNIPPTIHGVISGRLDRLDRQSKRILQEASVIGRAFLYDILQKVTDLKDRLDYCLSGLEHLDLIKMRSFQPELEYLFKHALTQDVVYSGLLKKERRLIHERIGQVIEYLFSDRLPEFYETLAFHYRRGVSINKAASYMARSGKKCMRRYALKEAHDYYSDAYALFIKQKDQDPADLVRLLNQWSFVYYYRGHYKEMLQLLSQYSDEAENLEDRNQQGMFFAWMGCALWHRERFVEARKYMLRALELGHTGDNRRLAGYACSWLSWICTELGQMEKAVEYAQKAQHICGNGKIYPYIYVNSLAGMGYAYWHSGDRQNTVKVGEALLAYGKSQADVRSKVMGHCCIGWSQLIAGNLNEATACFEKAASISNAPWYSVFPKLALVYGSISMSQFQNAARLIGEISDFSQERGAEFAGTPAYFFNGVLMIASGKIRRGLKLMEKQLARWSENNCLLRSAACGFILARVYAGIIQSKGMRSPARVVRNLNFMLHKAPMLDRHANAQFDTVVQLADQIGARGTLGQAYLHWGLLHRAKGRTSKARECLSKAIEILTQCEADTYVREAQEALDALE